MREQMSCGIIPF